jgi:hypothetical protein
VGSQGRLSEISDQEAGSKDNAEARRSAEQCGREDVEPSFFRGFRQKTADAKGAEAQIKFGTRMSELKLRPPKEKGKPGETEGERKTQVKNRTWGTQLAAASRLFGGRLG